METYLTVAAVAIALGFAGGWKTNGWRHDSQRAIERTAAQRDLQKRIERVDEAATRHEDFKEKEEIRYVDRVRVVKQLVDRPVYRNVCLDADGVRLLNDAIAGRGGPGESAPAVPRTSKP